MPLGPVASIYERWLRIFVDGVTVQVDVPCSVIFGHNAGKAIAFLKGVTIWGDVPTGILQAVD